MHEYYFLKAFRLDYEYDFLETRLDLTTSTTS